MSSLAKFQNICQLSRLYYIRLHRLPPGASIYLYFVFKNQVGILYGYYFALESIFKGSSVPFWCIFDKTINMFVPFSSRY